MSNVCQTCVKRVSDASNVCQTCVTRVSNVFQTCVKCVANVFQMCIKCVSHVCQTCAKRVSIGCQTCVKRVSNVCQTCVKRLSNVCQRCVKRDTAPPLRAPIAWIPMLGKWGMCVFSLHLHLGRGRSATGHEGDLGAAWKTRRGGHTGWCRYLCAGSVTHASIPWRASHVKWWWRHGRVWCKCKYACTRTCT